MSFCIRGIALLTPILFFTYTFSFGQSDNARFDSLKKELTHAIADTQKANILMGMVSEMGCTDTTSKLFFANQAKGIAEKLHWTNGIIKSNLSLGNIYFGCMGSYKKAFDFFVIADTLARTLKDTKDEIESHNYIACIYQKFGQYKQAIDYYNQVITLYPTPDQEMSAWGNLGVEYNSIGDYNHALDCYYKSLKILNQLQKTKKTIEILDTIQMAGLLLNIGDIYKEMALPDKAFKNYDSVYKIGISINTSVLQIIGLMGMGEVYLTKNNYDQSIECYQNALRECKGEQEDFKNEVKVLNQLANSYLGKGDLDKAMEYAQNSLKLSEENINNEQLPKAYITLGKVYLQQGKYDYATNYLQQALDISQKTGAISDEKDAWLALDSTYKRKNLPAKALDAYEHYITIRDKVYNIEKANEFTRQELDFEYKSNQQEDRKKIAQQQSLIYSGFAGLVLVILLVFFVYRNYNTQKKYNELLSREKTRHLAHIEAQDTVLTDIAHIQSHEVRGPVATILGLVQIFNYEDPADPVNKEVMEGLGIVTERLDTVVKEVILMENKLKTDQKELSPINKEQSRHSVDGTA